MDLNTDSKDLTTILILALIALVVVVILVVILAFIFGLLVKNNEISWGITSAVTLISAGMIALAIYLKK